MSTHRVVTGGNQGGAFATCSCGWSVEDDSAQAVIDAVAAHKASAPGDSVLAARQRMLRHG